MEKFNIGDCVRLKSGGIKMTVRGYIQERQKVDSDLDSMVDDVVVCDWQEIINGKYEIRNTTYMPEQLELNDSEEYVDHNPDEILND